MSRNGASHVPGPRYLTPIGVGREMRRDRLAWVAACHRDYGDIVRVQMGPLKMFLAFHPDDVKHVLQENHQNYVKGPVIGRVKVLIGEGLFTSEGDFWRRQRRLAQPAFHKERLAGFVDTMVRCTAERMAAWAPLAAEGRTIDVADDMNELTLTVAGLTLFSQDLSGEAAETGRALRVAIQYAADRALSFVVIPTIIPTARNRAFRRARRVLDDVVYGVIDARQRTGEDAGDLLSMLLAARDEETGEGMTRRQLRDEVITFFLAGHETTAVTLAWAFYLLAQHPEIEARLRSEVQATLGARPPTLGDLPQLPLARRVVQESMRLYPPVWGIGRQAVRDDTLSGHHLPAGTLVSLSPYVTHRHPDFWDEPERFDPDRFAPAQMEGRHRFAYFPFSSGPRLCIGESFALMEAQIILAMVVQRYQLQLSAGQIVDPEVHLTLRPRGGLPMTIVPSSSSTVGNAA